jgi:hypothetical protein
LIHGPGSSIGLANVVDKPNTAADAIDDPPCRVNDCLLVVIDKAFACAKAHRGVKDNDYGLDLRALRNDVIGQPRNVDIVLPILLC